MAKVRVFGNPLALSFEAMRVVPSVVPDAIFDDRDLRLHRILESGSLDGVSVRRTSPAVSSKARGQLMGRS